MAQINLTLDEGIVKGLLLGNDGAAMKQLMEKLIEALLSKEAEEQVSMSRMKGSRPIGTVIGSEVSRHESER